MICTIVGMGPGMGMALARRFAVEGYDIAMISRGARELSTHMKALEGENYKGRGFPADASDVEALVNAFGHIHDQMGQTDVLIYNPAAVVEGPPTELDPQTVTEHLQVNVVGALVCAQQVVPHMREHGGTILLTGGGLALNPMARYASLGMGKAALRNLAYSLHQELVPQGIRVSTITIAGFIQYGTYFDPNRIADWYWQVHTTPLENVVPERIYKEA